MSEPPDYARSPRIETQLRGEDKMRTMRRLRAWFANKTNFPIQDRHKEQRELCDHLKRFRDHLEQDERHFLELMESRLDSGLPLHKSYQRRLEEISSNVYATLGS